MDDKRREILAMLEWSAAMGADEAIGDEPFDWFAASAAPAISPHTASPEKAPSPARAKAAPGPQLSPRAAPPTDAGAMAAREQASASRTLDELLEALRRFDGCPLKKTAKHLCFARGAPNARLMLIGEAPGREEDLEGLPFVGRAGQLLDRMLAAIGMSDESAYITNVIYWRPPGNRTPTPQETQACQPFLERQIELVNPDVLVFLGGAAAKQLLGVTDGIMKLRGKWLEFRVAGEAKKAIATLHPAYLLRSPAAKRLAWRDLLMIKAALDGEA